MSRRVSVGLCSAILLVLASLAASRAQEPESTTPEEFQPFEYLLGAWKGTSVPTANKLRGWVEKHQWSWKFAKGKPVGMAFTMQDSKVFSKGLLTYNAQTKTYVIEAEGPKGEKHEYTGTLNEAGDVLKFDRKAGATGGGRERVVFGFLDNKIRYTMKVDRKPAGSPDYTREIDTGLTKEGEAFAAGGASADLPKCIVTGGSAALTVSFNGQTYPVCCSGCIDEFKDNPEKYLKKYALRMQKESGDGLAKAEAPAAKDADLPKAKGCFRTPKRPRRPTRRPPPRTIPKRPRIRRRSPRKPSPRAPRPRLLRSCGRRSRSRRPTVKPPPCLTTSGSSRTTPTARKPRPPRIASRLSKISDLFSL